MISYAEQKAFVVTARYGVDAREAPHFIQTIDTLARQGQVAYSVRNEIRRELKTQGYRLPPRAR